MIANIDPKVKLFLITNIPLTPIIAIKVNEPNRLDKTLDKYIINLLLVLLLSNILLISLCLSINLFCALNDLISYIPLKVSEINFRYLLVSSVKSLTPLSIFLFIITGTISGNKETTIEIINTNQLIYINANTVKINCPI